MHPDVHPVEPADESLPLRELRRIAGGRCRDCAAPYTAHEAVWNIALGFKDAPRCSQCLGRRLGRDPDNLRRQLTEYVTRRDCYRRAWLEADRMEGPAPAEAPAPAGEAGEAPASEPAVPDAEWDAGGMGCGELVMELRGRLNSLPAGAVIKVRATDLAAPEDIPAWCRLCGHRLLAAAHPHYLIRRREG